MALRIRRKCLGVKRQFDRCEPQRVARMQQALAEWFGEVERGRRSIVA